MAVKLSELVQSYAPAKIVWGEPYYGSLGGKSERFAYHITYSGEGRFNFMAGGFKKWVYVLSRTTLGEQGSHAWISPSGPTKERERAFYRTIEAARGAAEKDLARGGVPVAPRVPRPIEGPTPAALFGENAGDNDGQHGFVEGDVVRYSPREIARLRRLGVKYEESLNRGDLFTRVKGRVVRVDLQAPGGYLRYVVAWDLRPVGPVGVFQYLYTSDAAKDGIYTVREHGKTLVPATES